MSKQDDLKKKLSPMSYHVTQEQGTEVPFSGALLNNHDQGMYQCIVCGADLFSSDAKFDSGTGWPSFDDPANKENVELIPDHSMGMNRVEVRCKICGAHLGHLFDGPTKTHQRYCINSAALNFKKS